MIVRLVLEHHQPLLDLAVDLDGYDDRSRIHFLGIFHVIEVARALELTAGDGRDVHEANRLALAVETEAHLLIAVPSGLERSEERRWRELDGLQFGEERRVTAMVGPVGIEEFNFRERRLAVGGVAEMLLAEDQVGVGHRQAERLAQGDEFVGRVREEALKRGHGGRHRSRATERAGLGQIGLTGIDRVDQVGLDALQVFSRGAADDVRAGGTDDGAFPSPDDLEALRGGVGALVELTRQEFHGEGDFARGQGEGFQMHIIHRRFGEDRRNRLADGFIGSPLDVVALEDAETLQAGEAEGVPEVTEEPFGFGAEGGLLFDKKAFHEVGLTLGEYGGEGR